jgi:hypothetical protein
MLTGEPEKLLDSSCGRKGARFYSVKVKNFGSVLNVYADDVSISVQVDNHAILNLARINAGSRGKINV